MAGDGEDRIERRSIAPVVDQALELAHVREAPVVVTGEAQALAVGERLAPRHGLRPRRLLPLEPRARVDHGAVPLVHEAPLHGTAERVRAVLSGTARAVAGDLRSVGIVALRLSRRRQPARRPG